MMKSVGCLSLGDKGVDSRNILVESEIMSVVVFQRRLGIPTVVFGSLVLSCLVTSWSCLLFVDHNLRLNLAWLSRS